MFSPLSSRPSTRSLSNLGDSIRSRVSEGLARQQSGVSTSAQTAGAQAAAQAQRIREAIMSRFTDGFEASPTSPTSGTGGTTRPTGVPSPSMPTAPAGTSGVGGTAQPPVTGTAPAEQPYEIPGTGEPTDTSAVPKSGDPMLDQWDSLIAQEASKWGVPPENLKALIALESGGDPNATQINPTHGNTYGLAQINQSIWGETAAQRGYDLNSPEGQIGFAASLLRDHYDQTGDWDQAHSMYFNPSGTGDSVNGTSNAQYIAKIHEFINSWS